MSTAPLPQPAHSTLSAADVLHTIGAARPTDTEGEPWEPFIPISPQRLLPPFPIDVLPAWVRDMATSTTTALQVPIDLPGTLALACLAVAAGGKVDVAPKPGWTEPTNLYTVTALAPGSRKSPAFSAMTRPLYEAETTICDLTAPARAEAVVVARRARAQAEQAARDAEVAEGDPGAAIAEAVSAAQYADAAAEPVEPRLLADDLTPETAASLLAAHDGRLGLLSAEGGSFTTITGTRYSASANLEPLLKAHAGDMMRIDRKGRPAERIDRPALTIAITTQPGNLAAIAGAPEARERGLLARFLYCLPINTVGQRMIGAPATPEAITAAYGENLRGLTVDLYRLDGRAALALEPGAVAVLEEFETWIEPQLNPDTGSLAVVTDWASKMAGTSVRLAGLLHLAEHATAGLDVPITAATMGDAIRLTRYYLAHALTVFDTLTADPAREGARRVLDWLERTRPATFTRRELHRALESKTFATAADLDAPLALLTERGYLRERIRTNPRGGRPSTHYETHPALL